MFGSNFEDIYCELAKALHSAPEYDTRGMKTKEILALTIGLGNPRARLLNCPPRQANYGFAVGEFLWYLRGVNDLESISYYNKRMGDFSNDGKTVNSAYGKRMFTDRYYANERMPRQVSQWQNCLNELLQFPSSRRAVIYVGGPADHVDATVVGSKDVPCTMALQFFIRDNALHLHTSMRSNDAIWGLAYDLFSFTLLQEYMLLYLNQAGNQKLSLGNYMHTAGSMHLYERHYKMTKEIISWYYDTANYKRPAPMEPLTNATDLLVLAEASEQLRIGVIDQIDEKWYTGTCKWMAQQLNEHRRKRNGEAK